MLEFDIARKIKDLRLKQHLKIQDIADRTGLSKGLISKIENNRVSPPLATLSKISRALGIQMSYFFQEQPSTSPILITRRGSRQPFTREIGNTRKLYEPLALELPNKKAEPYVITQIRIKTTKGEEYDRHQGEEFVYVLEGKVEQVYGSQTYVLQEGDSAYFKADVPHITRAVDKRAKCLVVLIT